MYQRYLKISLHFNFYSSHQLINHFQIIFLIYNCIHLKIMFQFNCYSYLINIFHHFLLFFWVLFKIWLSRLFNLMLVDYQVSQAFNFIFIEFKSKANFKKTNYFFVLFNNFQIINHYLSFIDILVRHQQKILQNFVDLKHLSSYKEDNVHFFNH